MDLPCGKNRGKWLDKVAHFRLSSQCTGQAGIFNFVLPVSINLNCFDKNLVFDVIFCQVGGRWHLCAPFCFRLQQWIFWLLKDFGNYSFSHADLYALASCQLGTNGPLGDLVGWHCVTCCFVWHIYSVFNFHFRRYDACSEAWWTPGSAVLILVNNSGTTLVWIIPCCYVVLLWKRQ